MKQLKMLRRLALSCSAPQMPKPACTQAVRRGAQVPKNSGAQVLRGTFAQGSVRAPGFASSAPLHLERARVLRVGGIEGMRNHWATKWTEGEAELQEATRIFAEAEIRPRVSKMDKEARMDPELIQAIFDNGLMGIEAAEEYGGLSMNFTATLLAIQEIAKVDPAVAVMVDIHNTLTITAFNRYATDAQKSEYLPRLCTDTVSSFCLSEAGSGSDAFALKTRADFNKEKGVWVLNGTKCWISNSKEAGLFLVFANGDFSKGHRGISCFIVEGSNPGLSIGKAESKLGIRASSTCEVVLEDCEVAADCLLGPEGQGYKIAIGLLNEGRIGIGAQMVGLAEGALDSTMPYLHQRKQFGKAIGEFQGMEFQIARAYMELEAAKLLVFHAARLLEGGEKEEMVKAAAMAKLSSSEVAQKVTSQCIDWLGGVGFTCDFAVEKFFRDSKIGTIYEGTSNIQLQTIAKLVQAKYRD